MGKIEPVPAYKSYSKYFLEFVNKGILDIHDALYKEGIIQKINRDYLYWSDVKYKVPEKYRGGLSAIDLWSIVKENRLHDRRYFELGNEGFYFTKVDSLEQQLYSFDRASTYPEQGTSPNEIEKNQYLIGSIMEESIASSQIEGAVTSRVIAKEMLRKNRIPRDKSEQMIVNNYQTIRHIVQIQKEPLTQSALMEIHRLITSETLDRDEEAGQLRNHDDIHVMDMLNGEIIHTPPAASVLPAFVEDFCRFFNDKQPDYFIHPVVKASLIHFLIGYFHPFTDGNGRTARALFYWYLLREGYWLTEYLSISRVIKDTRTQYYRAIQCAEADENDLTYFVLYQVKTLIRAYDELKKYIDRKNQEKRQRINLQRDAKLSPRQAQIVEWLSRSANETVSIKEVEIRLGVSNQTARNDINALVKAEFLEELPINGKERHYVPGHRLVN